jgi:hypothetical protein
MSDPLHLINEARHKLTVLIWSTANNIPMLFKHAGIHFMPLTVRLSESHGTGIAIARKQTPVIGNKNE